MDVISSEERKKLMAHFRLNAKSVDYTITTAFEYADKNAPGAPDVIRAGIARVFIAFMQESDAGEKRLLRMAIDRLIDMGGA